MLDYVTFLTTKQIRQLLYSRDPEFFRDRKASVRTLDQLIVTGIKRREKIFLKDDSQTRAFLEWFEPVFLKDLGHI